MALQTDPAAGVNLLSKVEDSRPTNHGRLDKKEAMVAPNKDVIKTEELLGHGRFQFHILVCAQLSAGVLLFHHLSIYLLAPEVDHWCRPPGDQASLTPDQWKNMSIPFYEDGTYSKCTMYDPLELKRDNSTEVPCTQWDFDLRPGIDTIVSEWKLVCGKKWVIRVVFVYSLLGGLIFVPLQGQLADKVGRWPIICVSITLCFLAAAMAIFSVQVATFAMARMFLTASFSTLKMVLVILLFESLGDDRRVAYCCFVEMGSVVGSLAAKVLENFQLDWKIVCMITVAPTVVLMAVFYTAEESIRWLLSVLDIERVEKVTIRVSRINNADIDIDAIIGRLIKSDALYSGRSSIALCELLTIPILRFRTLVLSWIWFSLLLSFYSLDMLGERSTGIRLNLLESLPHLVSVFTSIILLSDYSRKAALSLALPISCGLICVLAVSVTIAQHDLAWVLIRVTFSSISTDFMLVHFYSLELYPTRIRGTGIGALYFCGKIGASLSPLLVELSDRTHPTAPILVVLAITTLSLLLVRFLPETRHHMLPDILEDLTQKKVMNPENSECAK